jgi:hypothetical protein
MPYRVSHHLEMIGVHLLRSRPAIDVLVHLLQKLYHLVGLDVVAHLLGRILNSDVFHPGCCCFFNDVTRRINQFVATLTSVKPSPFRSLTRPARAVTEGISDSAGSSTHVLSYSGRRLTKGGRLGS